MPPLARLNRKIQNRIQVNSIIQKSLRRNGNTGQDFAPLVRKIGGLDSVPVPNSAAWPCCSSPLIRTKKHSTQCVLVFLGAMEGTRTPGLLIRSARRAIPSIFGSYVLTLFLCDVSQVLNFEFLHPLSDFATICTLCTF